MLTFSEPSTFWISSAASYFLCILWSVICEITEIIVTTSPFIIVIIFVFQRLLSVFYTVFVYLFSEPLFIEKCFLFCKLMLHLSVISSGFDVCCINKHCRWIHKFKTVAVLKNALEYLLEEVCVLKSACIVLAKC